MTTMNRNHDLDDALNREIEKRAQNRTEKLSDGLEKAIQDTRQKIDEAFRQRAKVPVSPRS